MKKVPLGEYDDNYSLKILNKLDVVEVIDKNGIEDMGLEKFIKQLWEHVIGGIS